MVLDHVQSDTFKENDQPISVLYKGPLQSSNDRFPFLANLLDPRYRGNDLCDEETDKAMEYILKNYPDLMASIVNYKAKTGPFHQYMFVPEKMNLVSPITWWHSQSE